MKRAEEKGDMSDPDLVMLSFELAAESGEDITQRVHEAFIAASPQSGELMDHMDEHMLGRMMAEVLTVLMAEDAETQRSYLHFEVDSHRAYGVEPSMYPVLLTAVRDGVRAILDSAWNHGFETAWVERMELVGGEIALAADAAE